MISGNKAYICLIISALLISCDRIFMEPSPSNMPKEVFLEYANLVKTKYAMLKRKGVNIDEIITKIAPTINNNTSQNELFEKMSMITYKLKDGHSALIIGIGSSSPTKAIFDILRGYPKAFDYNTLYNSYVNNRVNPTMQFIGGGTYNNIPFKIVYGHILNDSDISYCWIPSWNADISEGEMERFFSYIKSSKGLILDLRGNSGGSPYLSTVFASYFTDTVIKPGVERFKIGPSPNDFKDNPVILTPASSDNRFLKPVIVLTDRYVYSASTTFLYLLIGLDRFKTLGQKSGGGSGSVADGFLANGWYWSLSVSEYIDNNGNFYDDGIVPDIPVRFNSNRKTSDEIIERAYVEMKKMVE